MKKNMRLGKRVGCAVLLTIALFVTGCRSALGANALSASGVNENVEITPHTFTAEDADVDADEGEKSEIATETFTARDEETKSEADEVAESLSKIEFETSAPIEFDLGRDYVLGYLNGSNITLNGEHAAFYMGHALSGLIDDGFQSETDLSEMLESCAVSAPIQVTFQGKPLIVRVVNPYEKAAPLSECFLAYAQMEQPEISYGIFDDFRIGTATIDEISDELKESAYRSEEGELQFKTSPTFRLYSFDIDRPYGAQVMEDPDMSMDLTFTFGPDGVLTGIKMAEAAYLYNGLDDNVAGSVDELDETQVQSVTATRDDILGELARAFQEADVDVQIDPRSGSIRLGDEILFAFNESALSDAGKEYLDRFVGVYASVVLGDAFADQIDGIEIGGHTDTAGSFEINQALSEQRAQAVYDYCMESTANGMDDAQRAAFEQKAIVKGYSFSDPVFDDKGEINADASRRVEIRFLIHVEDTADTAGTADSSDAAETADGEGN